jgi:hypothetical protein
MSDFSPIDKDYFETLKERKKQSRIYLQYQLTGLEIARILGDENHKSLYIKLAKNFNGEELFILAKTIAENHRIENKGAYFMRLLYKK